MILFETTIPFQLAFYALLEHEAQCAPLWDSDRRGFVGMMTICDFVKTLRRYQLHRIPLSELGARTIAEMFAHSYQVFGHNTYLPLSVEASVLELCSALQAQDASHVPLVDLESGNLVALLGHGDVLLLLNQAAANHPELFMDSVQQFMSGSSSSSSNSGGGGGPGGVVSPILTAHMQTALGEVMAVMETNSLACMPVVDDSKRAVGLYQLTDVAFMTKTADAEDSLTHFSEKKIGDVVRAQQADQIQSLGGSASPASVHQFSCICSTTDPIRAAITQMVLVKSTMLAVVDISTGGGVCVGVLSAKDLITTLLSPPRGI